MVGNLELDEKQLVPPEKDFFNLFQRDFQDPFPGKRAGIFQAGSGGQRTIGGNFVAENSRPALRTGQGVESAFAESSQEKPLPVHESFRNVHGLADLDLLDVVSAEESCQFPFSLGRIARRIENRGALPEFRARPVSVNVPGDLTILAAEIVPNRISNHRLSHDFSFRKVFIFLCGRINYQRSI